MRERSGHPQVMVMPPLIFLGYLCGALALNWAVPFPMPWITPSHIVGGLAVIAGFLLSGSALLQMAKVHTSADPHQPTIVLVTKGPYRFTRNPIYLGFLMIYLGFTLLAATLWGVLLSPFLIWTVTQAVIHAEEDYLEGKFREQYADYKFRVRRWV